jgi:hypothetical protein
MSKRRPTPYYRAPKAIWRRAVPAVAVVAAVAVIAGLFLSRSNDSGDSVELGTVNGEGVLHRIYLDGWSYRTLNGQAVTVEIEGSVTPLNFASLDENGIDAALERDPEIVQNTLARLTTGDSSLRCTSSGCTTDKGRFDHQVLADMAKVPALGSMYTAWRIPTGMYIAEFRAQKGSVISIGAEGWSGLDVREAPEFAEGETTIIGEFDTEIKVSDLPEASGAVYGYGRRSWDLGAAFGTFFIPEVRWDDVTPDISARGSGSTVAVDTNVAAALDGGFLAHGLADRATQTLFAGLDNSQLTYFSSPVAGCGVAALCVPGSLTVEVTPVGREASPVCSEDGRYAVAVAVTSEWEATLIGQTHIFGAWNGKDPAAFTGSGHPSVLGYSGNPPLVGGLLSTRQLLLALVDASGEVFAIAGARAQIGVDGPEYTTANMNLDDLERYFNGNWKKC